MGIISTTSDRRDCHYDCGSWGLPMLGSCLVNNHLSSWSSNFSASLLTRVKKLQAIAQLIPGRCGNWPFLQPSRVATWFTNSKAHPRYAVEVTKGQKCALCRSSSRNQPSIDFTGSLPSGRRIISIYLLVGIPSIFCFQLLG